MLCSHDIAEMDVACAADGMCPLCMADEIRSLTTALRAARIQLSALGGTNGVHMSDADAAECGCDMIQREVIRQIDTALKD